MWCRALRLQCKYKKELGESYGIKFDRLSWPVFIAGSFRIWKGLSLNLEVVGMNPLAFIFAFQNILKNWKDLSWNKCFKMLENACILRFHHFITRCRVKTCLFWNEHLFAWLHGGCFDEAIPSFRGLGFVFCRDCQGSWRSVTCQSSVISTTCKRKAPVSGAKVVRVTIFLQ